VSGLVISVGIASGSSSRWNPDFIQAATLGTLVAMKTTSRSGLVLAVLLSLALVGCNGNGGGKTTYLPRSGNLQASAFRVIVPGRGQGVGTLLRSGVVVTGTHVLLGNSAEQGDIGGIEFWPLQGLPTKALPMGGNVQANTYTDVTFIRPAYPIYSFDSLLVAQQAPIVNEHVTALLLSAQRQWTSTISTGKVVGYSWDGQFFVVSGMSIPGDSGGPIVNSRGDLVGIVVGNINGDVGFPFNLTWLPDGRFNTNWLEPLWTANGTFIVATRVFP
jgi:hypothetical protein